MNLISWSPFRELDDFFDRYAREVARWRSTTSEEGGMQWRPSADIVENDNEYVIKADLPEVKKDDIDVRVDNGILTLSGERRVEKSTDREREHRRETFYGKFARSFSLPDDVDADQITAESRDGVLKVRIPKTAAKRPKSVEVKVS